MTANTVRTFALWSLPHLRVAALPPRTLNTFRPLRPAASTSRDVALFQAPVHSRKNALAEQSYRCSLPPVTRWFAIHQRSCRPCPGLRRLSAPRSAYRTSHRFRAVSSLPLLPNTLASIWLMPLPALQWICIHHSFQ